MDSHFLPMIKNFKFYLKNCLNLKDSFLKSKTEIATNYTGNENLF